MNDSNIILTDSYKVSHYKQYPPGTTNIYSYWESRGGLYPEVTMFGLQYYLLQYLSRRITQHDINYAAKRFALHFGDKNLFNQADWEHILHEHNGRLPLRIKAVPEGMVIPTRNVLMTIENTDPKVPWLTNYVETLLSLCWYTSTVATLSREIKKLIKAEMEATGGYGVPLPFKLHDFMFRGVSSVETARLGSAAHLVNFMGTDTMPGLELISDYYENEDFMAGFSIPAAEHSTITAWGETKEADAYKNMLEQFGQNPSFTAVAVVSDSYDIFNACEHIWGEELKGQVQAMKNGLVVRPDSGIPHVIVVQVIETLNKAFGHTINAKGFKTLNNVKVIQGDGVSYDEIKAILSAMRVRGWSADNCSFGMGGALGQKMDRDTEKFAIKASSAIVNGQQRDIFKSPVTDTGKRSKKGRLKLVKDEDGVFTTIPASEPGKDELHVVFENGSLANPTNFREVRERAELV